jgi:hypothetical protein
MCTTLITFLTPLSIGGNQVPWSHPLIAALFVASCVFGLLFSYVELRRANEPIFPLALLMRRDVVFPYAIIFLQNIAQTFVGLLPHNTEDTQD